MGTAIAAAQGVPQDRVRYFLVASATGEMPLQPTEDYQDHRQDFDVDALPPITLQEAIFDLPARSAGQGFAVERFIAGLRRVLTKGLYRPTATALLCMLLVWPYYRTSVQAYLLSQTDNRSKAELWMTNRLPQGSKIAVLQYEQIELDPQYFQIQDFYPTDYVFGKKDFAWFRDHGFDYIAVSASLDVPAGGRASAGALAGPSSAPRHGRAPPAARAGWRSSSDAAPAS